MNKLKEEWAEVASLWKTPEIKAFWTITTLQSLGTGWFFGTYTLFLLANGMSLFQATILNAIFMATDTIFNPYTGKLADKYGQKKLFLSGQIFWFAGMLWYGLSGSFWGFAMAEMISALGAALMSDALESWLRNNLPEEKVHRAMSHSGAFQALGIIPAATLGGLIGAKWGLEWPWFVAAATGVLVITATVKMLWKLPEVYKNGEEKVMGVLEVARQSFQNSTLRTVALVTFGVSLCTQPFNMFWSPIMKEVSGQSWWLGSLWIGIALMASFGSYWAKKQSNGMGVVRMVLIIGVPMMVASISKTTLPIVSMFLLHEFGRGAYRPILFTFANRHISNSCRSTANSLMSSMKTMGSAVGLLMFGWMTTFMDPLQTWTVSALLLVLLAGWMWKRREI